MSAPSSSQSPSLPAESPPPQQAAAPTSEASRVRGIIREQFGSEVNYKEGELGLIEDRIHLAKMMLQRLRLGVLAQHYGVAAFYPTALDYREETIGEQHNWEAFEEYMSQQESSAESAHGEEEGTSTHGVGSGSKEVGPSDEEVGFVDKEAGPSDKEAGPSGRKTDGADMDKICSQPETSNHHNHVSMETSLPSFGLPFPPQKEPPFTLEDPPLTSRNIALGKKGILLAPLKDVTLSLDKDILSQNDSSLPPSKDPSFSLPAEGGSPTVPEKDPCLPILPHAGEEEEECAQESRFYFKKRVIVGNTSQYLDPAAHHVKGDGSTHKWMVYVRGPQAEPNISHFVKAVRFFLHPSYHPNDIVHVRSPPFHLTRLGWGEFPVRVQLEFCDKFNKSVDIIHNLVLDRTHTGQQTLGAETVVDLDIVTPPPGDEKMFRMNGVSISSFMVSQGEELRTSTANCSDTASPLPPISPPAPMELENSAAPDAWSGQTTPRSVGASVLTTNLDKCLHTAVRNIPIYGKANPAEDFYIPAPSLAQFRLWHIGRRRATEWQRAVAIKNSIARKLKLPGLLSTKQVMQWCRQNGYTPLDPVPASGRGFCKVCGCQLEAGLEEDEEEWVEDMEEEGSEGVGVARKCPEVHEHCQVMMFGRHGLPLRGNTMDPFEELHPNSLTEEESMASLPKLCSLSQPHDLVSKMFSQQGRLEDHANKLEEDVDVCSLPPSPSCARSRALVDMVPRFRVPQTPELKWVQQTAAAVGIHIYPAVIDRMYAHVVEHMIYISCTRFLRGVLAQAVQGSGKMLDGKLSQDRVLTPFHVQQAILKLEHCDFLTNQYLGVQPPAASAGDKPLSNLASESSSAGSSDEGEGL